MFGIIISSRPVLTQSTPISPTQTTYTLPSSPPFSHIVVFLLPDNVLPADTGAAVYIQFPGSSEYTFLGALGNDKPSAIFKVHKGAIGIDGAAMGGAGGGDDAMVDDGNTGMGAQGGNITLGISLEPIAQIQASLASLKASSNTSQPSSNNSNQQLILARNPPSASSSPVSTKVLAQRIIANAYNFLASFSGNVGPGGMEVVPLKSFQDWWRKFEKKVELDPGFLEREQS